MLYSNVAAKLYNGTHMLRDMCFSTQETHITGDNCSSIKETHTTLDADIDMTLRFEKSESVEGLIVLSDIFEKLKAYEFC